MPRSTAKPILTADQARAIYRATVLRRALARQGTFDFAAPTVPGSFDDGLVPVELIDADLSIEIPRWTRVLEGDLVTLRWDGYYPVPNNEGESPGPGAGIVTEYEVVDRNISFPLVLKVPEAKLEHGPHTLSVAVTNESGTVDNSIQILVEIDRRAPIDGQSGVPLLFPSEIENEGLTIEYLANNGDQVVATVPHYRGQAVGDKIRRFWGGLELEPPVEVMDATTDTPLPFTGAIIREAGDALGQSVVVYRPTDRAGNVGAMSEMKVVNVVLKPLPSTFPVPVVPLAADGKIDLEDARLGVTIEVPYIDGGQVGDRIVASWGTLPPLASLTILDPTVEGYPLVFRLSRTQILAGGSGDLEVKYKFYRGVVERESQAVTITVDIDVPGPTDPDPETPENEALRLVTVTGGTSTDPNKITEDDVDQPVNVNVPSYAEAKEGEIIKIYWGDQVAPVATYPLKDTDINPIPPGGWDIALPWSVVRDNGNNPEMKVFYTLTHPTNGNSSPSPQQSVNVHFVGPGGPSGLNVATFLDLNSSGWIIRPGLEAGTRVNIEQYENWAVGDKIKVEWYCTDNLLGTGNLLADSEYSEEFEIRAGQDPSPDGWTITIPYEKIEPVTGAPDERGSGVVKYTVTQGSVGYSPSGNAVVKIDIWAGMKLKTNRSLS